MQAGVEICSHIRAYRQSRLEQKIINSFDPIERYSGQYLTFSISSTVAMLASFLRSEMRFDTITAAIVKLNKLADRVT